MRRAMLICLLLAGCSAREAAPPADQSGYAVRLAVTPAAGGGLQRIRLPAEALAALRSPDRVDVRLFDREGSALPIARIAPADARDALRELRFDAYPILGPAGALEAPGTELRIEQRERGRVVTVTQGAARVRRPAVLGVLFDTRAAPGRARSLRLDAVLPPQQPVRFMVEASADLADWTPIGSTTLYRHSAGDAGALGSEAVPLGDADLGSRYLRLSWTSAQPLLAPVEVKGAWLAVARRAERDDRPAIATSAPRLIDAYDLRFALPRPLPIAAVAIALAGGEMLVPVRVLGRAAPDQPWTPLGAGSLRAGTVRPIELGGAAFSLYRIEADRRTTGFAAPPRLRLLFEPASLAALFNGKPPYTLAAGAAGVENPFLPVAELIPGYRRGAEARLPEATVAAATAPTLALAEAEGFSWREGLLWGLLLLGVAALGAMVWRLWRPARTPG